MSSLTKQQEDEIASFPRTFPCEWLQLKNHSKHNAFWTLCIFCRLCGHGTSIDQQWPADKKGIEICAWTSLTRTISPQRRSSAKFSVLQSWTTQTEYWSIYSILYSIGNHWNIELQTYLASMASMALGCASRSARRRGLKELAEDKIQDPQTRMRALRAKNLSQDL